MQESEGPTSAMADSCVSEAVQPLVKASVSFGPERCTIVVSNNENALLSDRLVELKGKCMEFIGDYLLRHNAVADIAEDPLEEGSDEEEKNGDVSIPRPKKRK